MSDRNKACPDCHRATEPIDSFGSDRRCVSEACGWYGPAEQTLQPDEDGGWS